MICLYVGRACDPVAVCCIASYGALKHSTDEDASLLPKDPRKSLKALQMTHFRLTYGDGTNSVVRNDATIHVKAMYFGSRDFSDEALLSS